MQRPTTFPVEKSGSSDDEPGGCRKALLVTAPFDPACVKYLYGMRNVCGSGG
jgi:hypothetical protein